MAKISRKNMRRLAVDCVFAYDFKIEEEQNRSKEDAKNAYKPLKGKSVLKPVAHSKRRFQPGEKESFIREAMKAAELAEAEEKAARETEEKFDIDEFIIGIVSSNELIGDGEFDDDKFRLIPDYEDYLLPVVSGVAEHFDEINANIAENSIDWAVSRIKKTDLAILRVAVFEILFFSDVVPVRVAVNEAVENAKRYDEKSGSFVNGVLSGIIKKHNIEVV